MLVPVPLLEWPPQPWISEKYIQASSILTFVSILVLAIFTSIFVNNWHCTIFPFLAHTVIHYYTTYSIVRRSLSAHTYIHTRVQFSQCFGMRQSAPRSTPRLASYTVNIVVVVLSAAATGASLSRLMEESLVPQVVAGGSQATTLGTTSRSWAGKSPMLAMLVWDGIHTPTEQKKKFVKS